MGMPEPTSGPGSRPGDFNVSSLDPNLPIDELKTMEAQIYENLTSTRLLTSLTVGFAALAAFLAGLGLYGVLAYNVARRTREIGIRMAIGATGADVRRMVAAEVGIMLAIGAVLGLVGAYAGAQVLSSQLFGMSAHDPVIFAGATVLLALVALVAAYVPALRATRVDPMSALRHD